MHSFLRSFPLAALACAAVAVSAAAAGRHAPATSLAAGPHRFAPVGAVRAASAATVAAAIDTADLRKRLRYPERELKQGSPGYAKARLEIGNTGKVKVLDLAASAPAFESALRAALDGVAGVPEMADGEASAALVAVYVDFAARPDPSVPERFAAGFGIRMWTPDWPSAVADSAGMMAGNGQLSDMGHSTASVQGDPAMVSPVVVEITKDEEPAVEEEDDEDDPDPTVFMMVDWEPQYDEVELARAIVYPEEARREGIEGRVIVHALVGKNGRVKKAMIDEGEPGPFDAAAIQAVKTLHWKAARLGNRTLAAWVRVPVNFHLSR
jgi:TonB family protein